MLSVRTSLTFCHLVNKDLKACTDDKSNRTYVAQKKICL